MWEHGLGKFEGGWRNLTYLQGHMEPNTGAKTNSMLNMDSLTADRNTSNVIQIMVVNTLGCTRMSD